LGMGRRRDWSGCWGTYWRCHRGFILRLRLSIRVWVQLSFLWIRVQLSFLRVRVQLSFLRLWVWKCISVLRVVIRFPLRIQPTLPPIGTTVLSALRICEVKNTLAPRCADQPTAYLIRPGWLVGSAHAPCCGHGSVRAPAGSPRAAGERGGTFEPHGGLRDRRRTPRLPFRRRASKPAAAQHTAAVRWSRSVHRPDAPPGATAPQVFDLPLRLSTRP
jgi:hypothetical protein